jgi:hypothetical protein
VGEDEKMNVGALLAAPDKTMRRKGSKIKQFFQVRDQGWKILSNRLIKDVKVNAVVTVNQTIAHSYNLSPRNGGIFSSPFWRNVVGCLSDNFDQSYQRKMKHPFVFNVVPRFSSS